MNKPPVSLEDLTRAGVEESLGKKIKDMSIIDINPQHHSLTGNLSLQLEDSTEKQIFFKKHLRHETSFRNVIETCDNLHSAHLREATFLETIYLIDSGLVPRLLGRLTNFEGKYFLFLDFLKRHSQKESYHELAKAAQTAESEDSKREINHKKFLLVKQDVQYIARFIGKCSSRRLPDFLLPQMEQIYESTQKRRTGRVAHYLKRAVHYWELGGKDFFKTDGQEGKQFKEKKVNRYLKRKKNLDLNEKINQIFPLIDHFKFLKKFEIGDCHSDHNFQGTFCDLEDAGYYDAAHDLVTYTAEETIRPPVSELPQLLAYYQLLEKAYSLKSPENISRELKELEEVDSSQLEQFTSKKIPNKTLLADFAVNYLTGAIEENILINGIRKKYSLAYFKRKVNCPGCTPDGLQRSRMEHIEEIYHFLASVEAGPLFENCTNRKEVMTYFFEMGKLLNLLSLTKIDHLENLERSTNGQFSSFYSRKSGKGVYS